MWGIQLNRKGDIPLARQLYQALRGRVSEGLLRPGDALPSTREMARQLGISRNTACEAYAMLLDEGFAESRQGAPTRVAAGVALEKTAPAGPEMPIKGKQAHFSADFRTGKPDFREFPDFLWRRMMQKGAEALGADDLDYGNGAGLPALREEIARWLLRGRGLEERAQDIFITAGTTQALALLPTLPALAGGTFLMEDPCHVDILQAWTHTGLRTGGVPVDEHGLRTDVLGQMDLPGAHAIYVTPSHQFPIGGILPAGRRAELVRLARDRGLYIIEDDYDSEFRYSGAPIAPLRSADAERVIYAGTFSKTLFPALRVGFVILPEALQRQWLSRRRHADVQNPPFEQAALAELLRTRKFDRHVQRMRRLYGHRRDTLVQALGAGFGGACEPIGDAAGLHVAVRFPGMRFDGAFVEQAKERGIYATPAERYAVRKGAYEDVLILGFGHLDNDAIISAVEELKGLICGAAR